MPLYNWVRKEIETLSYIRKVTLNKGSVLFWYYEDDDKNKKLLYKKLPYRATKHQLNRLLNSIKEEIGYFEKVKEKRKKIKKEVEKPLIFADIE